MRKVTMTMRTLIMRIMMMTLMKMKNMMVMKLTRMMMIKYDKNENERNNVLDSEKNILVPLPEISLI
jgi:hypothetical protein